MKEQNISCNQIYLVYLLFSINFCDEELIVCVCKDTDIHRHYTCEYCILKELSRQIV